MEKNKMGQSRTKKSAINVFSAIIGQFCTQLLSFAVRTVFIRMLAVEYLGVNGLFANVLSVMSLAELGFGASITYSMYAPMAQGNIELIQSYMNFYKKVYRALGMLILVIGISLTPFLNILVSSRPNIEYSLELIFLLYIIKTSGSYFYAYKTCILTVDQKSYVANNFSVAFTFIKSIIMIIQLVITKNFLLYTIIEVLFVFMQNIVTTRWCERRYAFLKECNDSELDKEKVKILWMNVKAMFLHKISSVVLNSSDNIIISKMIGIVAVGIYSNYSAVIVIIRNIIYSMLNAIIPSIGNLCASENKKQINKTFYQIYFIVMWITGFSTCGIALLMNDFIELWAGVEYVLDYSLVAVLAVSFYIQVSMRAVEVFRTATGLFYNDRYVAVAQCVINIVVSVIMVEKYGIQGIFVGTSIAMLSTLFWVQPLIFYSKILEEPVVKYFIQYISYTVKWVCVYYISKYFLDYIEIDNWIEFIVAFMIIVITSNVVMLLMCVNMQEFKTLVSRFKNRF